MRVTIYIMAACFVIFLLQVLLQPLTVLLALTPTLALNGMYWQFVTYMFAHADIHHFGFNMLALFIFGTVVERFLGIRKYLTLYLLSGIGSAVFHLLLTGVSDIPMLGASGAVFAVLTAYAFKYPKNKLIIFPIPVPISAIYVVIGFIAFSVFAGFVGVFSGIAHFGHLGGIAFGALIMLYWRRKEKSGTGSEGFEWVWESW